MLIAAGITLAVAAILVVYRGHEDGEASDESPPTTSAAPAEVSEAMEEPAPPIPALAAAASPPPAAPPPTEQPPILTQAAPPAPLTGEPAMTDEAPAPPSPSEADRRLFPVVTLLRDEVSGELVLQVGTRTYRDPAELRGSPDWTRVEYAARDLGRWMQREAPPTRTAGERRDGRSAASGTMIEQINRILEGKLAGQPAASRAVRLVEGPGGAVRVYIGVQAFSLDEVPDPAIRSLIREAVAEWEAGR